MTKAGEQPTITQPLRKIAQLDGDGLPEHTPQVMVHIANAALANSCDLGVGCEEAGVCYAKANGKPEMCHRTTSLAAQDGLVDALEGLLHPDIAHVGPYAGQRVIAARKALAAIKGKKP